jgi:hypothetical protein
MAESLPPKNDKLFLDANEKLCAAKSYLLFTADSSSSHSFYCDLSKLNMLELKGFLKVASERISELEYINREPDIEDEDDEEDS